MHGTFRLQVALDGERIIDADTEIGYLHRCFEKESEYATYTQVFPYTERHRRRCGTGHGELLHM
jgi:NADH:ubiquinone oxidoreductase subunit D